MYASLYGECGLLLVHRKGKVIMTHEYSMYNMGTWLHITNEAVGFGLSNTYFRVWEALTLAGYFQGEQLMSLLNV